MWRPGTWLTNGPKSLHLAGTTWRTSNEVDEEVPGWQTSILHASRKSHGRTDICVTLQRTASGPGLFFGTVQHIMVDALQDPKVCDRWMPRALTEDNKAQKDGFQQLLAMLCSAWLQLSAWSHYWCWDTDPSFNSFHYAINHGVETPQLTRKKKSKETPSAGKVPASIFCDLSRVLL